MVLLKQVISDLLKDIWEIIFYGFITSMVIMAFVLISLSFSFASIENKAVASLADKESSFVMIKNPDLISTSDSNILHVPMTDRDSLDAYLTAVFSSGTNIGTIVQMPGILGYQNAILLMGSYVDLTPFEVAPDEQISFAVSPDLESTSESYITVKDKTFPLKVVPDDMYIFHPLHYMGQETGGLDNALFVFCRDYSLVKELFPKTEYLELREETFLERMIFLDPTQEQLVEAQKTIYDSTGMYTEIQSTKDYIAIAASSGLRTHFTYLLFYISATLVLAGAAFFNIYRILKRKTHEYAIHHLYGATKDFTFARMFLFAFSYQLIPFLAVVYILTRNKLGTPLNLTVLSIAIIGIVLFITIISHRRVFHGDRLSEELRGD